MRGAEAQAIAQQVTLDKLRVVAPRAGVVDSLPFKLGDQAPVGAPLAILNATPTPLDEAAAVVLRGQAAVALPQALAAADLS